MNKVFLSCIVSFFAFIILPSIANAEPANNAFSDDKLYQCIIDAYNSKHKTNLDYDTNLTDEQLGTILSLDCSQIKSFDGIDKLTNLKTLTSNEISWAKSIDLTKNTSLTSLTLDGLNVSSLDLTKNTELTNLTLKSTGVYSNLSSLDLTKNTELTSLDLDYINITSINLTENTNLNWLRIKHSKIPSIDLTKNTELKTVTLDLNNSLGDLDFTKNDKLEYLSAMNTNLTSVNLTKNTELKKLFLHANELTNLDLTKNTKLTHLMFRNNKATELDLSQNINLVEADLQNLNITSLDVSNSPNLSRLLLNQCQNLVSLNLGEGINYLDLQYTKITSLELSNATQLGYLNLYACKFNNIDLTKNTSLYHLDLWGNNLTTIDLTKNTNLKELYLDSNKLTSIDLSKNTKLTRLSLGNKYQTSDKYLFKGDTLQYESGIKITAEDVLPSNINYNSTDDSIATVNDEGLITAKKFGNVDIAYSGKTSDNSFTEKMTIHVSDMSTSYNVDNSNNTITVRENSAISTVLNNITVSNGEAFVYDNNIKKTTGTIAEGYKIKIENDNNILKEYTILTTDSAMKGDINNDNQVTLLDVRLMLQKVINNNYTDEEKQIMDYNDDNNATLLDVRLFLQQVVNNS